MLSKCIFIFILYPKNKRAKNNIERGRGAKGYRVGVFTTVSQLSMSGSVDLYLCLRQNFGECSQVLESSDFIS